MKSARHNKRAGFGHQMQYDRRSLKPAVAELPPEFGPEVTRASDCPDQTNWRAHIQLS